ncbi:MAG: GNAT family N-acetyltransferase [Nitrospira sp.]|nr:MAG: GNAT family N-acetyltransferase [Nitrospira sp.]
MPLVEKIIETYDRFTQEGLVWFVSRSAKLLRESLCPPWVCLYWLPIADAVDVRTSNTKQAGSNKFRGLVSRPPEGVELRVFTNLSEINPQEYQALKDSVGGSDIPVYQRRFSQGVELHVLFIDQKVAGTLSFVFGKIHRFQHVVLTDRDAMALDGRIDPKYRGHGLYPIFLSLSIEKLKQRGIERLFIDTNENNEAANRSYASAGFRFLLKYKTGWGRYRFDRKAI